MVLHARAPRTMKALRFHGKEDVRIEEIPIPEPGEGQVLLRNAYAGICGSDLHIYFSPESCLTDFSRQHPVTGASLPQVLGHEFSGTVHALGAGVEGVSVGDTAAVWGVHSCGQCGACLRGHHHACALVTFQGVYAEGGGMAEYCVVDAQRLHLLPPGVDLRMGALVEPMSVAWHAVQIANVAPDHRVVILGAGPIGMGVYFALRARGVDQIAMVDMAEERLALARQSGVPVVVDGGSQDPGKVVMEWAAGTGLHHVIDAAGSSTALEAALGWLGFRGTVTVVALHGAPAALHPNALVRNELKVCGSQAYAPEDFDAVIQAMQEGHYDFTDWIDVVPLEGFEDAVVRLRRGKGMKTLICAPASC